MNEQWLLETNPKRLMLLHELMGSLLATCDQKDLFSTHENLFSSLNFVLTGVYPQKEDFMEVIKD